MFCKFDFCFFFLSALFSRMDLCLGSLIVISLSQMLYNEIYWFFLIFLNLVFNFQKSRISLFVTVFLFLTLCPYSSHSNLYHSSFVLKPTIIFVILVFFVILIVKILNEFSFFLDFCYFFGLQFLWFVISLVFLDFCYVFGLQFLLY